MLVGRWVLVGRGVGLGFFVFSGVGSGLSGGLGVTVTEGALVGGGVLLG